MVEETPERLEDVDPELGDLIARFCERSSKLPEHMRKIVNCRGPEKVDGIKVGRNDPCSCGSGFKYKKCCGAER